MELIDVVMKLTGPVEPVGDEAVDDQRMENLTELMTLTSKLLRKIDEVAQHKGRPEHSIHRAGSAAQDFKDAEGIQE